MERSLSKYNQASVIFKTWAMMTSRPARQDHWEQILIAATLTYERRKEEINTTALLRAAIELHEVNDLYWAFAAYALADSSIGRLDQFKLMRISQIEVSNSKGYANGKTLGQTEE